LSIYITSDLHFGHNQPFLYEPRGFSSIEEHDKVIITNINEVVNEEDTLYILGDLMLNDTAYGMECLKQIKCQDIRIILGNHDTSARIELYKTLPNVSVADFATLLKYKKWNFMLSHYPMLTTNLDDDKKPFCRVWNCCGHSHTKEVIDPITKSIHCELDAWGNYPVNLDVIKELVKEIQEK
jgi:calcineurin-like phosphoesterase family protein